MSNGFSPSEKVMQDYFDSLLDEAPPPASPPLQPVNITALPVVRAPREPQREPSPRPYAEPVLTLNLRAPLPPVAPPEPQLQPAKPEPVAPPIVSVAESPAPALEVAPVVAVPESVAEPDVAPPLQPVPWLANGRPHWAQEPFECLMFRVGGLALAAPLAELGSIYPLDAGELTSLFGQVAWFMGLLPVKDYNVRVIDTAQVVMPERYDVTMRERYRYVISLFGSDWGIAVDEGINSVRLEPDQVRWRGQRSKRPWLAGTVVEHMCALVDIGQLAWMFHNQDRKRRPEPGR